MITQILKLTKVNLLSKSQKKQILGGVNQPCPQWVCDQLDTFPIKPTCYCE